MHIKTLIEKNVIDRDCLYRILSRLDEISQLENVYPSRNYMFRCLNYLENAKVILIGQDPYHGKDQANGYCFAVNPYVELPPSLVNIFIELKNDIGMFKTDCTLEHWAKQGVVLLNTILSVSEGKPMSHEKLNWYKITDKIIQYCNDNYENLVFILWGANAQKKSILIDNKKHLVLKSSHPSPLSSYRGFFGSKPFSKTNEYLIRNGKKEIDW